jgi:hypothetical protein
VACCDSTHPQPNNAPQGAWLDDKDGLPIINMRDGKSWARGVDWMGLGKSIRSIKRSIPLTSKTAVRAQTNQPTGKEYRWIVGQVTNNDEKKGVCKLSFDIAGMRSVPVCLGSGVG